MVIFNRHEKSIHKLLIKKINKLNKKIHRAEDQNEENKVWWRKMKLEKLKHKLKKIS